MDPSLMKMYGEDPQTLEDILEISEGRKREVKRLLRSYEKNPEKFREILETARHESSITSTELRYYLRNLGEVPKHHRIELGAFAGGGVGLAAWGGVVVGGLVHDVLVIAGGEGYSAQDLMLPEMVLAGGALCFVFGTMGMMAGCVGEMFNEDNNDYEPYSLLKQRAMWNCYTKQNRGN